MASYMYKNRVSGAMDAREYIGKSIPRQEDGRLMSGQSRYVEDLAVKSSALHMLVLRSRFANAHIRGINISLAERLSGVVAIYTAQALGGIESIPCDWVTPGMTQIPLHPILAAERVHYVGQPLAIVVAENRLAGIDALEAIDVDYDVLVPVVEQESALKDNAPLLHSDIKNNIGFDFRRGSGDIDRALKEASVVLKRRLYNNRVSAASMETRSALSQFDLLSGELTHYSSSQLPHVHARSLANCLKFPLHKLHFVAPDVGGGFGGKLAFYPEDVLCAFAAIKIQRAVQWIGGRDEFFNSTTHGRDHVQYAEVAATKEGVILGLRVKLVADLGAYAMGMGPGIPAINAGLSLSGPYKIVNTDFQVLGVYTNRMPTGPYRGAGHPEASFLLERVMDELANELSIDPVEIRKRNFVSEKDMPYPIPTGFSLDSGDFAKNLDKALEIAGYGTFPQKQIAARAQGRYLGMGIACYSEMSGAAPTLGKLATGFRRAGHESARVVMHADGKVTVFSGTQSQGQGHHTSFAQIAAEALQVPCEDVDVVQGDTKTVPFGTGTYNSRSIAVGGTAIHMASEKILRKATAIAAHKLQCRSKDLVYANGIFSIAQASGFGRSYGRMLARLKANLRRMIFKKFVRLDLPRIPRDVNQVTIALEEIAREAHMGHDVPFQMSVGLDETVFFDPKGMPASFGAHICVVDVDIQTGQIEVLRHIAIDDCGRIINPLLAEGQIHGGVAQGLGQALMEQVVYRADGTLRTNNFAEYAMPRATDFPDFEADFTVTPTKFNPLGARGIGESGTIGAPPAAVNAVLNALRPLGVKDIAMPMTPHNVWQALQESTSV